MIQRTSRGTAMLVTTTGVATFSDGRRTWSIANARAPVRRPAADLGSPGQSFRLAGRIVASGIPGAGALSPVGTFLPGGPIHDDRGFAASTAPGNVLDATRLLVASTSNFGEPAARRDLARGAILSLSTTARARLSVPARFVPPGQARALDGAVKVFTAQAPAFLNRRTAPGAVTADLPAVSNPLGISVNNLPPTRAASSSRSTAVVPVDPRCRARSIPAFGAPRSAAAQARCVHVLRRHGLRELDDPRSHLDPGDAKSAAAELGGGGRGVVSAPLHAHAGARAVLQRALVQELPRLSE